MRYVLLGICVLILGCGTQEHRTENAPAADTPAMQLAKSLPGQEDLILGLKEDFARQIKADEDYWRQEFTRQLSGAKQQSALQEVTTFSARMVQTSEDLSSPEALQARMAKFFEGTFNDQELRTLAAMVNSPEWQKFQWVMRQLPLAPDALGVRADFVQRLREEQDLMGARIAGAP